MVQDTFELDLFIQELQRHFSKEQLDEIAKRTGFIKRKRKLNASDFFHLCLGESQPFLQNSLSRICSHLFKEKMVNMSTEGLNQRFNSAAVKFIKEVFYQFLCSQNPLLTLESRLFNRIRITDSTGFSLPVTYPDAYKGSTSSGVKIQLEYGLLSGEFMHCAIQDGRESDINFARFLNKTLLPGDLCIRDLGYFSVGLIKEIDEQGAYYMSRLRIQTKVYKKNGDEWEVIDIVQLGSTLKKGETIEIMDVYIGDKKQYIPRFIIYHLTDEDLKNRRKKQKKTKKKKGAALTSDTLEKNSYNFFITNVPHDEVSSQEIYKMYSLRWQIEILFKTWKSIYEINHVKKMKKERFECHLYGTLITILVSSTLAFQARTYLYRKKNLELSEYKAMNLLRDYFPTFLKVKRIAKEHSLTILELLERYGKKSRRGDKLTAGMIFKELGIK